MSIGTLYYSHSTSRGKANFNRLPFYDASITHNRDKASVLTFKSPQKLEEADRIIYENLTSKKVFGGQVVKRTKSLSDDYNYEVIDYTRLYQTKITASFTKTTSSNILKKLIKNDKNNLSTGGIQNTSYIHAYLKWENKSLWDIVEQLAWLEYKAGNHIYYDVDYAGNLIWKRISQKTSGYSFSEAYDYEDSHDSSDIITQGIFLNSKNTNQKSVAYANREIIAKWGYVTEIASCTPTTSNKSTSSSNSNCKTNKTSTTQYWTKCGLSPDKKLLCAIGKPSAPGENKYPYKFHKTIFRNKCPYCGKATLVWDWNWGSGKACNGKYEGGSAEGHIFCTNCDMDFGCINGREHKVGSKYYVKVVSKPVKSSVKEAKTLKKAKLQYKKTVNTSRKCKKSTVSSTSLKNETNIRKYNISSTVWKKALEITNPKWSEYKNARAIFNWVKNNTSYEGYYNTRYGATGTLKKRKGNCVDHGHLICALCRSVGIKCNYIHNHCISHVYNKIYINKKGVIVDTGRRNPSWGSHWGGAGCPVEKTSLSF